MFNFSISQTALRVHQLAIDTTSNNVANANTPGFHRREVTFSSYKDFMSRGQMIGAGVDISRIHGARAGITEQALTRTIGDVNAMSQRYEIESQIESLFTSGEGSLVNQYANSYSELSRLSSDPSQSSQRRVVLEQGSQLASQFRYVSNRLTTLKSATRQQIDQEVESLNKKIEELTEIQSRIKIDRVQGEPNQLIDDRDRVINEIAEIIDVDRNELVQGGFGLTLGGGQLSIGSVPMSLGALSAADGMVSLQINELGRSIEPRGGKLAALIALHNDSIGDFQNRVNVLASSLIASFDQAHAQGVGVAGPFNVISSTRGVTDVNLPLSEAGLTLPLKDGKLYLSVHDPNGEIRNYGIDIDPNVQSLSDLHDAINGIPNLNAILDTQNGEIKISAASGYAFDFTGSLETIPDTSGLTGTAVPRFSGRYEADQNDQYDVRFVGSGTVGQTPGLIAEVYDRDGRLVTQLDVGQGYEPGRPMNIENGVKLTIGAGTIVDGESFSTPLIANSDTSNVLSALGINSFFSGDNAINIAVSNDLLANPTRLASSRTGDVSDASNLKRIIDAKDDLIVNGEFAFEQFLGGITSEIGASVKSSATLKDQYDALQFQYESDRDAISGVDLNEEMINLTKYQRGYEASLRVISTIDQMYQEILQVIR